MTTMAMMMAMSAVTMTWMTHPDGNNSGANGCSNNQCDGLVSWQGQWQQHAELKQ
jgi:hypothetical protein